MAKAKLPSIGQLSTWLDQGKYKRIKDAVEAVPEEQWNPDTKLYLAMAYNNLADPGDLEGRKKLRRGLELLQSIEPEEAKLGDRYAFHFAMGFSWYFLDHPVEALPYFKKASQIEPYDEGAKLMVQRCQMASRRPKARWPFREGVWKAWETFEKQQPDILKQLEAERMGRCGKKLERMVSVSLEPAFAKPECSVWKTAGKPILVCNASDSIVKVAEVLQFFQQAPADIREVWDFQIGPLPDLESAPIQAFLRQYGDTPVPLFCTKDGEPCGAKLMDIPFSLLAKGQPDNPALVRLAANLQTYVGRIPFMHLLFYASGKPERTLSLRELPSALKDAGTDCSEESAEALLELKPYQITGDPEGRKFWREGKESGVTRAPSEIFSPEGRLKLFDNSTVQDGVEGGYLVWPITNGFKKKVQEETAQFQVQLQGWLLEQLGAECYYPMGRSADVNFAYLDFIAWDLQPVLETAQKLLQKAEVPWAVYRPYRDCDPAVSLFGFDAPPLQQS